MPFVKGDPNINRKGRPKKGHTFTDALRDAVDKQELAAVLVEMALQKKDIAALKYIYDRIDGTPTQTINQTVMNLPEVIEIDESEDPTDPGAPTAVEEQ